MKRKVQDFLSLLRSIEKLLTRCTFNWIDTIPSDYSIAQLLERRTGVVEGACEFK